MSGRRLVVVAVFGVAGLVGSAAASPESLKLFREGRTLLAQGKIPEACEAFASSQQLEPAVGTLVNLGDCRAQQGLTASALKVYVAAKELADARKDKRGAEVTQRLAAIQSKLAYITITIAPANQVVGLVIKRNGVIVEPVLWNTPVVLDPGSYVFEVSAPKFKPWSTTQTLANKAKLDVAIAALEPEPPAVPAAVVPAPAVTTATKPPVGVATDAALSSGTGGPTGPGAERRDRTQPIAVTKHGLPSPQRRYAGAGFVVGTDTDEDHIYGARLIGSLPVPYGAVRAIGSLNYARQYDGNGDGFGGLYALGVSVDYVWMPVAHLGFAVGAGIGQDRIVQDDGLDVPSRGWWTLRASPIVARFLHGRAEAGLHLQHVVTDLGSGNLYLLALDLFAL